MRTQRAAVQLGLQAITFAAGWLIAAFLYAFIAIAWLLRKASSRPQASRVGPVSSSSTGTTSGPAPTLQSTAVKGPDATFLKANVFSLEASPPSSIFDVVPMVIKVDTTAGHDSEVWRLVGPYLKLYGSGSLVSSTVFNPEFNHFFLPGIGSLVFCETDDYCRHVVMGAFDPITDPKYWELITRLFLQTYPDAVFLHVTAAYGQLLAGMGYYVNDMGAETCIQVQSWKYSKKTGSIRRAARYARESGVSVRELTDADLTPALRQQLQSTITGDWLLRKAVADRLLRVFIRFVDYQQLSLQHGVRLFLAEAEAPPPPQCHAAAAGAAAVGPGSSCDASQHRQQQQPLHQGLQQPDTSGERLMGTGSGAAAPTAGGLEGPAAEHGVVMAGSKVPVGFVLLDPIFKEGQVQGYTSSICRMSDTAHQGTLKLIYEDILAALKREGTQQLNFGFAPFYNILDDTFNDPPVHCTWVRWVCLFFYWCCNRLYAFKNLAFSKSRYGGGLAGPHKFKDPNVQLEHVYLAHKYTLPLLGLLDLYVVCKYAGIVGPVADTWLKLVGLKRGVCTLQQSV